MFISQSSTLLTSSSYLLTLLLTLSSYLTGSSSGAGADVAAVDPAAALYKSELITFNFNFNLYALTLNSINLLSL